MIKIPYKIVLIRHGQTDNNLGKKVQSRDTPLNNTGRSQAAAIIEEIRKIGEFQQIISSDLLRAKETAQILAKELEISELSSHKLFNERDQGILKGLAHQDVKELYPEYWDFEKSRINFYKKPENGESWDDLILRARLAIEFLNNHIDKDTIIVSHGGFMRGMLQVLNNLSNEEEITGIPMDNCIIHRIN